MSQSSHPDFDPSSPSASSASSDALPPLPEREIIPGPVPRRSRWVRVLVVILVFVSVIILIGQIINWMGAYDLKAAKVEMARQKESGVFRDLFPAPVEDARNFCAIEPLRDISLTDEDDPAAKARRERITAASLPVAADPAKVKAVRPVSYKGSQMGVETDLAPWAAWLREVKASSAAMPSTGDAARDILGYLAKDDAFYRELAEAAVSRPEAQWTPMWQDRKMPEVIFALAVPQYGSSQNLTNTLALRAVAAARVGETAMAQESLLIMLRLAEANADDPLLIGTLVAAVGQTTASSVLWELCHRHLGTDADFERLEAILTKVDYQRALLQAHRGELSAQLKTVQWMKGAGVKGPEILYGVQSGRSDSPSSRAMGSALYAMVPDGLFDYNAAAIARMSLKYGIEPLREAGLRGASDAAVFLDAELKQKKASKDPRYFLAAMTMPSSLTIVNRMLHTQCLMDQSTVACALERYRLANNGRYPESLRGITLADGKPLPLDVSSPYPHKPMGYRLKGSGPDANAANADASGYGYELWCMGPDGEDDGGKRVLNPDKPNNTDFTKREYAGDWVWGW